MRAMRAERFSGYQDLKLGWRFKTGSVERTGMVRLTRPASRRSITRSCRVGHPRAKAPLVLGNEGAGVIGMPAIRSRVEAR